MRKDIQKSIKEAQKRKTFYLSGSAFALILLIIAIGIIVYGNMQGASSGDSEGQYITSLAEGGNRTTEAKQASTQIGKTVNEAQEENIIEKNNVEGTENSNVIIVPKAEESTNQNVKNTIEEIPTVEEEKKVEETKEVEPTFSMPVEGEIIREYAKDKLVYSSTLKEWVTHSGIDIKADKTTIVKASEAGTIKSIKNDPRYGLTVVIEHSCGYSTVYSNLLTAEFVVVGEKVEKGQTIGTVGNTATFEIADDYHLHFEILKDNAQIDPSMYIK